MIGWKAIPGHVPGICSKNCPNHIPSPKPKPIHTLSLKSLKVNNTDVEAPWL